MKIKIAVSVLAMVLTVTCSGSKDRILGDSVDELLEKAFHALKTRDYNAYKELTITSADFVLKAMGISRFKEKQTYIGSSVKPAEIKAQAEQFKRAATGTEGNILFQFDAFVSAGRLIREGTQKAMNNVTIPYKMYSFKIKTDSGEVLDNLPPYVIIVRWGHYYRILNLAFDDQ